MNISLVGIDLAKNVYQVCGVNKAGKVQFNKKVSRPKLLQTISQLQPTSIAMEACYSSNYWGREFEKLGHRVFLRACQLIS